MKDLIAQVRNCRLCESHLPYYPKPIIQAHPTARLLIIGQAPGQKAHASGIPWNDASGNRLRNWLGLDTATFYDSFQVAIMPMGFCYPGKGTSGDLPPRPECAPQWHAKLLQQLPQLQLTLLIGQYAQHYYLPEAKSLTENIRMTDLFLPNFWPLPHPSPRNQFWLRKNEWFEQDIIPSLKATIHRMIHVKRA